ncbi:hypothetical protein KJ819_02715 [Patescibacteria group bacterium]|nr:hypothetical protein [Patescibacteria group bacterium]MBU1500808.1 hypothetical protein [Patescibacteria group bacterium]MBU2080863.1 hypothetical protein [Patescibacteria group bacterium]MBU2123968.1 hypothetical protein [Patescibacteria group bacterium]MBU2194741.1 hypothetical protein [Patescibacteria group bacterium]
MRYRWNAACQFNNVFMQEHGSRAEVAVIAENQTSAERLAKLEVCHKLGISTMMHGGVKIISINNMGRAR